MKYKIGIDPGKKTGWARMRNGILDELDTLEFWTVYLMLTKFYSTKETEIHIEDTNDLPVFHIAKNKRSMGETGRRVGSVRRETELLIEGLQRWGFTVIPHRKKRAKKINAEQFKRLFGWDGRTNEHMRDAACLII